MDSTLFGKRQAQFFLLGYYCNKKYWPQTMAMQPNMFTMQPRARISSTWYYITTLLSKFGKKWNIGPPGEAAAKWDRDSWLVAEGTLSTTEQNKENQSRDVDVLCRAWNLWNERNKRVFEQTTKTSAKVMQEIKLEVSTRKLASSEPQLS